MGLNHQQYNTSYLLNVRDGGDSINDAEQYGVKVVAADVAEGETYWRVIGVHHLLPRENFSNHHVFLEALDEEGNRLNNPPVYVGWTWVGRQPHEQAPPTPLDKPASEAGGNIAMHFGQVVSAWVQGVGPNSRDKSDRVENLHTAHPDEPLPDGALLNTLGHHSFYVIFQRTRQASVANGLITGRLERGQGEVVRLFRNNQVVAEQTIGPDLAFRFENLPWGVYRLAVVNMNVGQGNIRLDAGNDRVNINLAVPLPTHSVISGRVENGQNKILQLVKEGNIIARQPLPPDGRYRFENLGAGVYALVVFETNVRQDNIMLDGRNSRQVNLVVREQIPSPPPSAPPAEKSISHYLLLGPPNARGRQISLLLAIDFILTFSVTVGFSPEEARQARRVTVFGEGRSQADIQAIRDSGSAVEVLSGDLFDLEARLRARIRARRPFGDS